MSRNQRLGLVGLTVAVAVVAFVIAKSGSDNNDTQSSATAVTQIAVSKERPLGGIAKIKVRKGDLIRFRVSTQDTSDEVHVHGYDLHKDLSPGHPVSFRFRATMEGIFEAELEDAKAQILSLTVEPK